ncbi:MAG: hypothetical protein ACI4J1_03400 [Ruminiclostridium sp.]
MRKVGYTQPVEKQAAVVIPEVKPTDVVPEDEKVNQENTTVEKKKKAAGKKNSDEQHEADGDSP